MYTKIEIAEKGLNFAPLQRKINEPELRIDLKKFFVTSKLNGIFGMNQRQILAICQALLPSLHRKHLKVILIWKFFKSG